ncbi:MAG TPA: TetR-like C-terminal domain-containing protein [Solirubrobacterales bacterium]|nr:TetR-like C-terminal domain-containing protein [Solirubrobacterales bacterium]
MTPPRTKQRLDEAAVVAAAARLADAEGLEAATLSRIAAELGVRPPSLYNHVESHAALMRAVSLDTYEEFGDALRDAAVGRAREDAIRAMAGAYRDYATEHPGRYATTVRAPARDDKEAQDLSMRGLAPIVAVLAGWGIEGDEATHLVRVIRSALHGFVSLEQGGGFGIPLQIDESFDLLVDSLVAAIEAQAVKAS